MFFGIIPDYSEIEHTHKFNENLIKIISLHFD